MERVPGMFKRWKGVSVKPEQLGCGGVAMARDQQLRQLKRLKKYEIPRQARWLIQGSN